MIRFMKDASFGDRPPVRLFLIKKEMIIADSRRLRQVGNAKNLTCNTQSAYMGGNLQARLPADADVNFIKITVFSCLFS